MLEELLSKNEGKTLNSKKIHYLYKKSFKPSLLLPILQVEYY